MTIIKAPYNFVPLENTAFYPEWANHISQDIPFEDGVSGSIEYTITAKTPIFVRNGQRLEKDTAKHDNQFSQTSDGRYFIPGTSVKGEIRNILEILSLGKMTQVQDSRFGVRDLSNSDEGKRYRKLIRDAYCGWLRKDGDKYILEDCGKPGRISPKEIDCHFHSHLENFDYTLKLGTAQNRQTKEDDEIRSAYTKYSLLGLINSETGLLPKSKFKDIKKDKYGKILYRYDNQGNEGILVLTGQPSKRNGKKGKFYEFVFLTQPKHASVIVNKDVIGDFLTIHKNNYDFQKLWKARLECGEKIPVFFLKNGNNIKAIGLAYLFRYPTASFIKGAIPAYLQSARRKDLAECMFGTEAERLGALKGRVYFSPAFAEGHPQSQNQVNTTLSSPKASYGPLYVKGGTWDDSNAQIKGRKRYPVREKVWNNEQGNAKTGSSFIPLKEDTVFKGSIRFHNLKKEEYGALIAALTFNGHDECYHSIGEAKPLGYGKVKIDIVRVDVINLLSRTESRMEEALSSFNAMMGKFYPQWETCNSLRELYAMAKGVPSGRESEFTYLKMSTIPRDNEFKTVKDNGENLAPFTAILNHKTLSVKKNPIRDIIRENSPKSEIDSVDY